MTTISEILLIVCLVRKQLSVSKKAAEEIVVVLVGKFRCRYGRQPGTVRVELLVE